MVYILMLSRILTKQQQQILAEERDVLTRVQIALSRFDTSEEDVLIVQRSIQQLDELFLIVIVGEFNAGKSAFINALLGQRLLDEGVTPTTTRIHLIQHGTQLESSTAGSSFSTVSAPVDLLEEINFVDTPGTNAISREHEAITLEFIPRSDLVLFVTSADRPFTESERAFMEKIKNWGKKIVIVINKVDILSDHDDVEHVEQYVSENVNALLGFQPQTFSVSAKDALKAKLNGSPASLLPTNCFPDLERYILNTLDQRERIRLKLLNPVGVGARLVSKYRDVIDERLDLLKEDRATIERIDQVLAGHQQKMQREFRYRLADVDNVLHDFENRGMGFFDEHVRFARFMDLINKTKTKTAFEHEVVADMPQVVEKRVGDIIDWMVSSDLQLWQTVVDELRARRSDEAQRVIGQAGNGFEYSRNRLLETVGQAAQKATATFDREGEASRLAEDVQMAVASTALAEAGAVGLGAIVTAAATSAAADITGILAASVIAAIGLFVIPNKRRTAKKDLSEKVASVRRKLMKALTDQFDRETRRSVERIGDAMSPYTGFVKGETARYQTARQDLDRLAADLVQVKSRIEAL
ncbi:MAG: GTP-binding protein [Acidobacteria bacterium]|nr:MAG: GTP-binding protein [Acidobacteriota bacterium]